MNVRQLRSKAVVTLFGAGLCLAIAAAPARGAILSWRGADGASWHVGSNWDIGSVPASADSAYIANGHRATITSAANVDRLYIGRDAGGTGGGVIQNSGTATMGSLWVGVFNANSGTYVLNDLNGDSTLMVSGNLVIGESNATSTFTQNGGDVNANKLFLCHASGATARYELCDGSLNITGTQFEIADHLGTNVVAVFTQTGGAVRSNSPLAMGSAAGTTGSAIYDLLGGSLLIDNPAPFTFHSDSSSDYFNFVYGSPDNATLILKGTSWDFDSLTNIANADFRVYGEAAAANQLVFVAGTGGLADYTIIYAIPEPSAFLLAAIGLVALAVQVHRRGWSGGRNAAAGSTRIALDRAIGAFHAPYGSAAQTQSP